MLYRLCMLSMMFLGATNFGLSMAAFLLSMAAFLLGSAAVLGSWSEDMK
jgi:hypothetical protein